jgi:hypothetical protein
MSKTLFHIVSLAKRNGHFKNKPSKTIAWHLKPGCLSGKQTTCDWACFSNEWDIVLSPSLYLSLCLCLCFCLCLCLCLSVSLSLTHTYTRTHTHTHTYNSRREREEGEDTKKLPFLITRHSVSALKMTYYNFIHQLYSGVYGAVYSTIHRCTLLHGYLYRHICIHRGLETCLNYSNCQS